MARKRIEDPADYRWREHRTGRVVNEHVLRGDAAQGVEPGGHGLLARGTARDRRQKLVSEGGDCGRVVRPVAIVDDDLDGRHAGVMREGFDRPGEHRLSGDVLVLLGHGSFVLCTRAASCSNDQSD
jgi:hypothetical protein